MPTVGKLFVPRMEFAKVDSGGTTFPDGTNGSIVLSGNPNAVLTGTGNIRVKLDADKSGNSAVQAVDFAGGYFRNPDEMRLTTTTFTVESGTDPTYATMATRISWINSNILTGSPLLVSTVTSSSDKYWRFTLAHDIGGTDPKWAMLFVGTVFNILRRWNWGDEDTYEVPSVQSQVGYGRIVSRLGTTKKRRLIRRTFELINDTDLLPLQQAIAASFG